MKTQIPTYRAKKIDSDEYVEGFLHTGFTIASIVDFSNNDIPNIAVLVSCIDESTLAIHFPDMIDSEGTKIFASLSEDGKGGDRLLSIALRNDHGQRGARDTDTAIFRNGNCYICHATIFPFFVDHTIKVTGIQS